MAKAKDIEVTPGEAYGLAAARIVRVRAQELFDHAEDVLDVSDIERVHDMRVASRRLRAVLEIFAPCFPRAPFKSVLIDVKAIADALGERRDPDVHIDAMAGFAKKVTALQRPGVERLLEHQRERQARGNEVLATELERMERRDLRARLMALADAAEEALRDEGA
jgi:CHAD domain-containing protein